MAVVGSTVYLHSTNTESSSSKLEEGKNDRNSCVDSASQKDLQLLTQLLQECLRAEIPSGEFFLVRCASKKKQTMILVEHPEGVRVNTEAIFAVLEEALESELDVQQQYVEQYVELFLRTVGTKLPYAKRSLKLTVEKSSNLDNLNAEEDNEEPVSNSFSTAALSFPLLIPSSPISEQPGATLRDVSTNQVQTNQLQAEPLTPPSSPEEKLPSTGTNKGANKGILVAGILGIIGIFGTAGYFLSSPCVLSKCPQVKTAKLLTQKSPLLTRGAASESDLVVRQKKLNVAIISLQKIPRVSSYYREANELTSHLSNKSKQIEKVLEAFQKAKQATQRSQSEINDLSELQAIQNLWRDVITQLETISLKSELFNVVQPKLVKYRKNLKAVNQQLFAEEKWLKKIRDASSVAKVAKSRETKANSLKDLQKVQSNWQIVVNALKPIPKTSLAYSRAQQKLAQYQPKLAIARQRANKELIAAKSYEQLLNATKEAKDYKQINQLQSAVIQWKQALNAARNITSNTSYSQKAQSLVEPLTIAVQKAEQELQIYNEQEKTRSDLEKTCSGEVRVCEYTFKNKQIVVRITDDYEKALEQRLIDASIQGDSEPIASVNSHLQTLQEALEAISINSKSSLLVYDAQGNVIQESKIQ